VLFLQTFHLYTSTTLHIYTHPSNQWRVSYRLKFNTLLLQQRAKKDTLLTVPTPLPTTIYLTLA